MSNGLWSGHRDLPIGHHSSADLERLAEENDKSGEGIGAEEELQVAEEDEGVCEGRRYDGQEGGCGELSDSFRREFLRWELHCRLACRE